MFCNKCGATIEEGARFCAQCGTPVNNQPQPSPNPDGQNISQPLPYQSATPNVNIPAQPNPAYPYNNQLVPKKKKTGMIIAIISSISAVLFLIIAIFISMFLFGGRNYQTTIDKYMESINRLDGNIYLSLLPDQRVDAMLTEYGYGRDEKDLLVNDIEEVLRNMTHQVDNLLGDDCIYTCEIFGDEDVTGEALYEIQKRYQVYDIYVSEAKIVDIQVTLQTQNLNQKTTRDATFSVIKVGNSWYIDYDKEGGPLSLNSGY